MSTPADPQKGKPAEAEQIEEAAKESTEAVAQEEAAEAAEAPKPKRRRAKKAAPEAEGTAAAETGVDKDAAEAEEKPKRRRARKAEEETAESPQAMVAAAEAKEDADKPDHSADKSAAPPQAAQPARRRRRTKTEDEDEQPTAAGPARRRAAREPGAAPPIVRAQARYVRSSARKARLVCDHLRGKSVPEARAILAFSSRAVARDWSKVLESAIANAENNHDLVGDELKVVAAYADEGPTLKRFRPRAMGRATRIRKRTSHLTIKLTPEE